MSPADLQIPERESAPVVDEPLAELWAERNRLVALCNAADTDGEIDGLGDELSAVEHRIANTEARTLAGVVVQIKLRESVLGHDHWVFSADLTRNVVTALERLAGASVPELTGPDPAIVAGKEAGVPPEGDDDEPTGIAIVDLDAKDIARELTDMPWADRARFFNNAIVDALDSVGIVIDAAQETAEDEATLGFVDAALLIIHKRIGEVLDIWGLDAPPDKDAAKLFALSASSKHRTAARVFCDTRTDSDALDRLFKPGGLKVFKFVSEIRRPGLSEFWREHIRDKKREGAAEPGPDPVVTLFEKWAIDRDEATAHSDAIDALGDDAPEGARDEINTRLEAAWARTDALEDQIMATPATTMRGVAIKIRLASHYIFEVGDFDKRYATPARDIAYEEVRSGGHLDADESYTISALRDAERLAGVTKPDPDPVVTMSVEWGGIYDEMTALDKANPDNKSGELMDRWEAALERVRALEDRIIETPASSMAGVVIKLRIATDRVCDSSNLGTLHAVPAREIDYKEQFGGEEWTSEFIISALLDAERLAGVS